MNIKQLKETIKNLPDDMEIIVAKDGEGNGYSPNPHCYGDLYDDNGSAEECNMNEKEYEKLKKLPLVLTLWPSI